MNSEAPRRARDSGLDWETHLMLVQYYMSDDNHGDVDAAMPEEDMIDNGPPGPFVDW